MRQQTQWREEEKKSECNCRLTRARERQNGKIGYGSNEKWLFSGGQIEKFYVQRTTLSLQNALRKDETGLSGLFGLLLRELFIFLLSSECAPVANAMPISPIYEYSQIEMNWTSETWLLCCNKIFITLNELNSIRSPEIDWKSMNYQNRKKRIQIEGEKERREKWQWVARYRIKTLNEKRGEVACTIWTHQI